MLVVGGNIAGVVLLRRGNVAAEGSITKESITDGSIAKKAGAYERIKRFEVFWWCEGGVACTEGSLLIQGAPISILSIFCYLLLFTFFEKRNIK